MSIADYDKPQVVPIKAAAPTPLGYIAGSIQKLIWKDLMALVRGMEGDLNTDVGRAESLLAWAEKFENPDQPK